MKRKVVREDFDEEIRRPIDQVTHGSYDERARREKNKVPKKGREIFH